MDNRQQKDDQQQKTPTTRNSNNRTNTSSNNDDVVVTYYSRRVDELVTEIWSETPGIGMHDLLINVKLRLVAADDIDTEHDIDNDATLKRQIKAAKLALPYRQLTASSSSASLSDKKELFVREKFQERSSLRAERRHAEADRIAAGLQAMGIQIDDHKKTWTYTGGAAANEPASVVVRSTNEETSTTTTTGGTKCDMCGRAFASRNLVFKHLRDPVSSCGNSLFASNQTLSKAPSTVQREERKKRLQEEQNQQHDRSRNRNNNNNKRKTTGQTAVHTDHCLWMGDLPLLWTRHGGNYKRLRALLRAHLPRTVAPPWIKHVQRKAYRSSNNANNNNNKAERNGHCGTGSGSGGGKGAYLGYAIVVFRDAQETETVLKELNGREITAENVFSKEVLESNQDFAKLVNEEKVPPFRIKVLLKTNGGTPASSAAPQQQEGVVAPVAATVGVGKDPPLEDQLKPLTTVELLARTKRLYAQQNTTTCSATDASSSLNDTKNGEDNEEENDVSSTTDDVVLHKDALERAVAAYESLSIRRPEIRHEGRLIPTAIRDRLLDILRNLRWAVPNHRSGLTAERYLVLQTNVTNDLFYQHLRDACRALMDWTDADYYYSGIAVTKNFVSSPHIDDRDQSFQYAVSLGDFTVGGELCVDGVGDDGNGAEVIHVVNTHNRIARVDGRHVHWVRPWDGGDRYSLIFYDTSNRNPTAIMPMGVDC